MSATDKTVEAVTLFVTKWSLPGNKTEMVQDLYDLIVVATKEALNAVTSSSKT